MGNGCSISTITIDEKGYLFAPPSLATLWQLGRPLTPEMINEQYSPNLIYHTSHADCRVQTKCSEPFLRILLKYVMISYKFYICVV